MQKWIKLLIELANRYKEYADKIQTEGTHVAFNPTEKDGYKNTSDVDYIGVYIASGSYRKTYQVSLNGFIHAAYAKMIELPANADKTMLEGMYWNAYCFMYDVLLRDMPTEKQIANKIKMEKKMKIFKLKEEIKKLQEK